VIINQTLADRFFPAEDPLGRRIAWTGDVLRFTPFSGDWRTIVGVVGNTQDGGLDAEPRAVVFMPFAQELAIGGGLVIRVDSNASALTGAATRVVRGIAPTAPIEDVLTVAQIKDQSVSPQDVTAERARRRRTTPECHGLAGIEFISSHREVVASPVRRHP